jgi:hypothetical protein
MGALWAQDRSALELMYVALQHDDLKTSGGINLQLQQLRAIADLPPGASREVIIGQRSDAARPTK